MVHWLSASALGQYRVAQHCTAVYCNALHCAVLHYIVLHCAILRTLCVVWFRLQGDTHTNRVMRDERALLGLPPGAEVHHVDRFSVQGSDLRSLDLSGSSRIADWVGWGAIRWEMIGRVASKSAADAMMDV